MVLSSEVLLVGGNAPYVAACEAACQIWDRSACWDSSSGSSTAGSVLSVPTCLRMCTAVNGSSSTEDAGTDDGWGWNYVKCIESVVVGFDRRGRNNTSPNDECGDDCWKMTALCRDIFRTGAMNEYGVGPDPHSHDEADAHVLLPVTYPLALLAGIVSALYFTYSLFGYHSSRTTISGRRRRHEGAGSSHRANELPPEEGAYQRLEDNGEIDHLQE
jgi:hypothetical protein